MWLAIEMEAQSNASKARIEMAKSVRMSAC
jgi:hypothetical protein